MNNQKILNMVAKVFLSVGTAIFFVVFVTVIYFTGYFRGLVDGQNSVENKYINISELLNNFLKENYKDNTGNNYEVVTPTNSPQTNYRNVSWGGPDLWEAVNKRRKEFGVNSFDQKDDLCTIASVRLNELLELGDLDGHEGFGNMQERRPDLAHIFENYSTVAEFLALGGQSAQETVDLWENTLAHKKILTGGEYVWGCIYAQNSFAVAITAY